MRAKAIAVLTFLFFSISAIHGATQKVLYTFTGGIDGGQPYAGVILDPAGNLYGVTQTGGLYGEGTVFQLSPSPSGAWTETVLHDFTGGTDGARPTGGLVIDNNGNLFGTAEEAGDPAYGCGTLFELPAAGTQGDFTVLRSFRMGDGCTPTAKLFWVEGDPGSLWGTTLSGGRNYGTVFIFDLDGDTYSFREFNGRNGQFIFSGVNAWGYGTAFGGAAESEGDVYSMFPKIHVIHTFNQTNKFGYAPLGEMLPATVGGVSTMFGTTNAGGVGARGTVYALSLINGAWKASLLHSFSGLDGSNPRAGVTADSVGNLYGTTAMGGTNAGAAGTVFKLTPGAETWSHTVLYNFSGGDDGGAVTSGVVLDSAGNLYGTTLEGGAYNQGVVYEVVNTSILPPP